MFNNVYRPLGGLSRKVSAIPFEEFTLQMMLIKIFAEPKEGKENQGIKLN